MRVAGIMLLTAALHGHWPFGDVRENDRFLGGSKAVRRLQIKRRQFGFRQLVDDHVNNGVIFAHSLHRKDCTQHSTT